MCHYIAETPALLAGKDGIAIRCQNQQLEQTAVPFSAAFGTLQYMWNTLLNRWSGSRYPLDAGLGVSYIQQDTCFRVM